jgi:hypothetical protein
LGVVSSKLFRIILGILMLMVCAISRPLWNGCCETASPILYPCNHRVEDITEFIHLKQMGSEQHKIAEQLRSRAEQMEAEVYLRAPTGRGEPPAIGVHREIGWGRGT